MSDKLKKIKDKLIQIMTNGVYCTEDLATKLVNKLEYELLEEVEHELCWTSTNLSEHSLEIRNIVSKVKKKEGIKE